MKAKIDRDLCIGCGACADTCPDVFAMDEEKAYVKENAVYDSCDIDDAISGCPVEAISKEN